MARRSSRSEFRSGSDDIRGATSDSDLEPRSAASEDPSSETLELDEEQAKDLLSRAIQQNFPDIKNEARKHPPGGSKFSVERPHGCVLNCIIAA